MYNNPFAGYGKTVSGDSFVGRVFEIQNINDRLFSNEFGNVSIVGLPKIGKSSLMFQSLIFDKEKMWSQKRILSIWTSIKSYQSPNDFYLKLVLTVLSELKKRVNDELFITGLDSYLTELKKPGLSFVETEHNLLCFFSDISSAKIRVIVCLDEFDYAKELFNEVHYQLLRTLSYEPDHQIAFVATSRRSIYDIERYSGQGSNFFGTFENIRLGVFSDSEANLLFLKANIANKETIRDIKYYTGNHPYLISMVLYKYLQAESESKTFSDVIESVKLDILKYFDDVFYILEKDNLTDKLIRIYSGIYEGVSQSEEEYLSKYGLFIQDERKELKPFSKFFDNYLNIKWRDTPFKLIWPEAERALKKVITRCVNEIYGDDWERLIQDDLPVLSHPLEDRRLIQTLQERRMKEKRDFGSKASRNLIDQLYPRHFPIFIELHWDEFYEDIFESSLDYWLNNLEFLAKRIRNPESHSRAGLLSHKELREASLICTEIVEKVEKWTN
jgi:hypothetical protein